MYLCRGVAQLVAHSLWERGVASSSLATPTIFKIKIILFCKNLMNARLLDRLLEQVLRLAYLSELFSGFLSIGL